MIHQNIGKLLDWLVDMNTLNPKMLSADNFNEIKKAIQTGANTTLDKIEKDSIKGPSNEGVTINNEGAKIGQQNTNSNVDNRGASFNI
jgi:hypothetical protein